MTLDNQGIGTTSLDNGSGIKAKAADALQNVSHKILAKAPNEGPVADVAMSVASGIERTSTRLRSSDMALPDVRGAVRAVPTGWLVAGVALAIGLAAYAQRDMLFGRYRQGEGA